MKKKREKKSILIAVLLVAVVFMSVGYAALASQLDINGTAAIASKWDVKFTSITEGVATGTASNKTAPGYSSTTATFDVALVAPGDSMTYDIVVSNAGTLDAKLDSIVGLPIINDNEAIKYTVTGVSEGDILTAGSTTTITVKVEYDSSIQTQPTDEQLSRTLSVTLNYVQSV